ncbi:hypothetical protein RRF57_010239 [Xylaria bambusicola]|uniref:Uncharacterized protein n=1 Tax=Xylaria bambusicola TaxID=326684 RepID=A0AAN7UXY2_9PEZI
MEGPSSILAAYLVAGFATYTALLFSCRLFLHPLRDYAGPLLAGASDVYGGGIQAGFMSPHVKTREDLLKHGTAGHVIWPQTSWFSAPSRRWEGRMRSPFAQHLPNERVVKSYISTRLSLMGWNVFNVIDKTSHRFKRKLIFFIRIPQSSAQPRSPVNMTKKLKRLGIDTVSLLAFGYPLNTQVDEKYRFLIDAYIFGNYRVNVFVQFPLLKKIRIHSFLELFFAKEVRKYFVTTENMIASRVAEDKNIRNDLYSIVADSMNPDGGQYLKDSEIWAEAEFFFPAGGETTPTPLAAALFYSARNHLGTKSTFKDGREIKGAPVPVSCEYPRTCLDETMRIPPRALELYGENSSPTETPTEPRIVGGHIIPPGVQVGVNTYVTHHNEEMFPDSFELKPER